MTTCSVVVVGSLNHDLAIRLARFPRPDETLVAHDVAEFRGGKGYNQATASARLGAAVAMIGCVGDDGAGVLLRAGMQASGIDQVGVVTVTAHTGMAVPLITDDGEVAIVIVAGANALLDAAIVERSARFLRRCRRAVASGEVPIARPCGRPPGARRRASSSTRPRRCRLQRAVELADLVVVNCEEPRALGLKPTDRVVVTLGSGGVLVADRHVSAFAVDRSIRPAR